MGAGFQVWAQDGSNVVQIDGDSGVPNLQLVGKYALVTTSVWASYLTTSSVTDVVALNGASNPVIAVGGSPYGATVMWMSATQFRIIATGDVGTPVTVYVFANPVDSGKRLLQVFGPASQLIFDAGLPSMRVRAQYVSNALGLLGTLPAGRTYAAVVTAGMSRTYQNAGPGQWLRYDLRAGVLFNGTDQNQVNLQGILFDYSPPSGTSAGNIAMNQAQVLVLDVTGL